MMRSSIRYFYVAWDWRFLGLLIAQTVIDFYLCAGGGCRASRAQAACGAWRWSPRGKAGPL